MIPEPVRPIAFYVSPVQPLWIVSLSHVHVEIDDHLAHLVALCAGRDTCRIVEGINKLTMPVRSELFLVRCSGSSQPNANPNISAIIMTNRTRIMVRVLMVSPSGAD
jgi:hypothetical protein